MLAIPTLMAVLAQQRPIFHAEADFQHAFAWEIHRVLPDAQVRLELPVFAGKQTLHVDIWVRHPQLTSIRLQADEWPGTWHVVQPLYARPAGGHQRRRSQLRESPQSGK